MFIKNYRILLLIVILSAFLRLWNLSTIPPHLRNDEAALGYNAYSILKTGKDEHGQFLPIFFQSFGDWKLPLYVYLTVPFVAIFGLSEVSVRLPSALFGIISIWLIYEIVLQMFASRKLALISSVLFAISPICIVFSRGAWEVNISLTLTLFATFFFLKAVNKNGRLLLLSAFFFGLTLLTSHTAKLSTPIILMCLLFAYYKKFKILDSKLILTSILIGIIFTIPVSLGFVQGKVSRITTLSIFSYYPDTLPLLKSIATRWFNLYSFSTLFIRGDTNPQHTAPNMGPLLLLDSIFLMAGIIRLVRKGTYEQNIFIWTSLFLLSLPSALTIEKVNFERVLPIFMPLLIITSLGIKSLSENIQNLKNYVKLILVIFIFLYLFNYIYFLDQYFIHGPKKNDAWQYGYRQIVEKITQLKKNYQKIIVQQNLEHPYIFFLFYQKYDPFKYQQIVKEVFMPNKEGKDMGLVSSIDNIEFKNIDWSKNKPASGILYVMPIYKLDEQSKFYHDYEVIDQIKDLNGFPLFRIVRI